MSCPIAGLQVHGCMKQDVTQQLQSGLRFDRDREKGREPAPEYTVYQQRSQWSWCLRTIPSIQVFVSSSGKLLLVGKPARELLSSQGPRGLVKVASAAWHALHLQRWASSNRGPGHVCWFMRGMPDGDSKL